jgi:hypothetical protein
MKFFYVIPVEMVHAPANIGSHSLDLGNGKALICIDWKDDFQEAEWCAREGVMPLPHPIFQMAEPLQDEHIAHLKGRFAFNNGDNIHHLIRQAAKLDPWMRLHVL